MLTTQLPPSSQVPPAPSSSLSEIFPSQSIFPMYNTTLTHYMSELEESELQADRLLKDSQIYTLLSSPVSDEIQQSSIVPETEIDSSMKQVEQGKRLAELLKEKRRNNAVKKRKTKSVKAGLIFPVNNVIKCLKKVYPNKIIRDTAGVYLSAVLEYLSG
jgi:hypothetical protein